MQTVVEHKVLIDISIAMVQVMAWCDKPFRELMMTLNVLNSNA